MPTAPANASGIELAYEAHGSSDDVPLLLVMGLGAQLITWDISFVEALVDRGFYVIRFDNRDAGLSTKVDVGDFDLGAAILTGLSGQPVEAPYLLSDMADDAVTLLDHVGIAKAHIVGASMGGMIAQQIAIAHPDRVLSLTSIMSTTGETEVGAPDPAVLPMLLAPPATNRDEAIAAGVEGTKAIVGPTHFDEAKARERAAAAYDRSYYPAGTGNQLVAIVASGSRAEGLRTVAVPTAVIHGDVDPLVTPSGGNRTAELVPGAELLMLEGMGHDIPEVNVSQIIEAIVSVAARAAAAAN